MNYIRQINAFYDWLELNSLEHTDVVLWHALMHINNRLAWIEEFTVPNSTIAFKTGLSKKTIERSRNRLKQAGLIDWKSRTGNQSAIYKIISLVRHGDVQPVPLGVPQSVSQPVPKGVPINKTETKTKTNNDYDDSARMIFDFYESEFGDQATPVIRNRLKSLIDNYTAPAVHTAITEAVVYNARNLKYVETILKNSKGDNDNAKNRRSHAVVNGKSRGTDEAIYAALAASNAAWGGTTE